jgi:hypothetical protein
MTEQAEAPGREERETARQVKLIHILITMAVFLAGGGGGIGLGSLTRTQDPAMTENLKLFQYQIQELTKKVDALGGSMSDRFTHTMHKDWEIKHDQRDSMRIAECLAREATLRGRLDRLEETLRQHMREPWHVQAGAEHSETKRRVDRLEKLHEAK